jgi:Putative addiction module component
MTLEQLEAEVLALSKESQVLLLTRLLEHLGTTSEIEPEVAHIWAEEAASRDQKIDNGEVIGVPAEEVFRKIRASLQ